MGLDDGFLVSLVNRQEQLHSSKKLQSVGRAAEKGREETVRTWTENGRTLECDTRGASHLRHYSQERPVKDEAKMDDAVFRRRLSNVYAGTEFPVSLDNRKSILNAASYMSAGPSIEEVNGKNSDTSSIEDIHKREAKPHTLDATTQPEERGEPASQSDSAIRSPSPVTHASAVTIAEKPIRSPVYEPPHFASRHPCHQELTAYVNALLKHNPQPSLLSSANARRRTTSLRLPSGSS
ncbi:uncharacterized protein LOC134198336 [Corticium candelabrum]|uniref:uncharacterized protein LOC134198336 n=1 Tax=Corticium candelabrum TaxID=121492 RepID=UPI002E26496F|nr:uncharacterized protein LOC134198336 [Corticium candelabrum]